MLITNLDVALFAAVLVCIALGCFGALTWLGD